MSWTTEKPTKEGYYWHRHSHYNGSIYTEIVCVSTWCGDALVLYHGVEELDNLKDVEGEWQFIEELK